MKRMSSLILILAMLALMLPAGSAYAAVDYSWIKVRLTTNNATSLTLNIAGDYFIEENGAQISGGTLTLRVVGSEISVAHSASGEVFSGKSFSLKREKVDKSAGAVTLNGRRYLGHFNIRLISSGYIQVVNEVPLAHYLYGVVGHEMSDTFPLDALKAQAVAAKCYVLSNITTKGEYYLGDTSSDQVYKGYTASYTNVIRAVDATLTEVLTVNGQLLCTYYAASNGGETNLPTYAWPSQGRKDPGYDMRLDPYDLANPYSVCETVKVPIGTSGSLTSALYNFILAKASAALGIQVTAIYEIYSAATGTPAYKNSQRNLTKGVISARVGDSTGAQMYDVEFAFNLSELYAYRVVTNSSLRIYWGEPVGNYYYIYHVRWGHGVGMSQRGAQRMATDGLSYKQILSFYYPNATFSNISVAAPQDPPRPASQPTGSGVSAVITGNVNFRRQPNTSATIIAQLPKGTTVSVYASENGWAYALVGSVAGYISEDFLQYQGTDLGGGSSNPSSPVGKITAYGAMNTEGVNFRSAPNTSSASYGKLPKGTQVTIYGQAEQDKSWYKVEVNGTVGYIYSPYITITGYPIGELDTEQSVSMEVSTPGVSAYGEIIQNGVIFRAGPGSSYGNLGTLSKGAAVDIYAQTGDWLYIMAGGKMGYVSANYVAVLRRAEGGQQQPEQTTPEIKEYTSVYEAMTTTSNVNFRKGPDTSSVSMQKLPKNTGMYVLSETGDWYYVLIGTQYGYIYKSYVKITGIVQILEGGTAVTTPEANDGATGKGETTGKVNIRKGPGTTYTSQGTLTKGTALTLYGQSDGWYQVKTTSGLQGYVSGKYVTVTASYTGSSGLVTGGSEGAGKQGAGVTTGAVNFRVGPSTSAKKITQLTKGVSVVLYGLNDGWYDAEYNGTRGYLSAKYVKVTSSSDSGTTAPPSSLGTTPLTTDTGGTVRLASGITTGNVNFRTKPSVEGGAIIRQLSSGTSVEVLGQCGDWYYVLQGDTAGYLNNAYLSVTSAGSVNIYAVAATTTARSGKTSAQVNLRTGPGTTHSVIQMLQRGTAVTVYFEVSGWCFVKQGSNYGFASAEYISAS